mgnify:CR=1 FL=1
MHILVWVGIIAGIVTAIVAVVQLVGMRKARHSELIISLTQVWESPSLMKARQLANKLGDEGKLKETVDQSNKDNSETFFVLMSIPNFFDSLGAMIMKGDLPAKLARELFGAPAKRYWGLYENALTAADLKGVSRFQELGREKSSIW